MFRRIASILDANDVIGLFGLILLGAGAWLVDPRLTFFLVGGVLVLLAVARAEPPPPTEPRPPTEA